MTVSGRRLLVVEDEPLLRIAIADALEKEGWRVDTAEDGSRGADLFAQALHDLVITDLVLPGINGMDLLRRIKELQPSTTVIIVTAHGSVDLAVEAMKEDAADFITKPFSMAQLRLRLENVSSLRLLREQNVRLQAQLETRFSYSNIIGKSQQMQDVFKRIQVVADSHASVLVSGESGTGKELVAAAIHYNSPRASQPYFAVSCASLPESLIESELFGYEKGAFTGAGRKRIGRFEAASGGTLFLDEIGELPLSFQVKLLRVLEEGQIQRLGSNLPISVDVRVVSASMRPLEEDIARGSFREDLFFRTNTVTIHLPPLRDRNGDIPLLAGAFLQTFSQQAGKQISGFSTAALHRLNSYPWPGNVRELRNAVEHAVLFCSGSEITADHLPIAVRGKSVEQPEPPIREISTLQEAVEKAEIETIRKVLESVQGRRGVAAERLGISRKTLWEKVKNYGITGMGPGGRWRAKS